MLFKSIFVSNRERNKVKKESIDLCETNELLLDKYFNINPSGLVLINSRRRYDDIRLISEFEKDNILNTINFMYVFMDDDWVNESSYTGKWSKLFGKDYSVNIEQKKLVDEFIDDFIRKADSEYRIRTKTSLAEYIKNLSSTYDYFRNYDYFENSEINIETINNEVFELVDEFYNSHIKLLENTKKLSTINYGLETLNKELEEKQKEINKILDKYSEKEGREKLKKEIEASLNGLDNEKLLNDLNELFTNNTLNLDDSADFIIAEILQSITTSVMSSNEIIDFMLTHQSLLQSPSDKIKILTNIDGIEKQSLFIKKENVGDDGKFSNRFGLLKKNYDKSSGIFDLNEIIYGNSESRECSVERIVPTMQS